jgi:ketosteroid isomerase-like protein
MDHVAHVTTFLDRMRTMDFDAMAECVAEDMTRIGPFMDVKQGRAAYRDFLAETIPPLTGYAMEIYRVWSDGSLATAELAELATVDGKVRRTEEALTFEFAPDGLISKVAVYIQSSWYPDGDG